MILTYRYRVKSLNGLLNQQARAVNFVWNFCNDTQKHAVQWRKKWPSAFDIEKLTAGSSKELGLHSGTITAITATYVRSRAAKRRPYLRYRGKRSLGWIPIKGRNLKREGTAFRFAGNTFRVFSSRELPIGSILDGSNFSQDARGNWYLNIVVDVAAEQARLPLRGVGIDLGLKDFATLSTGERIAAQQAFRDAEQLLAVVQRARKKKRTRAIHAQIANRRADFLHQLSARIVREFDYIAAGNVNASGLAKTSMAKSVLDAGWSSFRHMLRYKAIRHGAWFEEVDERFSTQACSDCGAISGPKGLEGLAIRSWACEGCGCVHDRDVNAAKNILRRFSFGSGHGTPGEGAIA